MLVEMKAAKHLEEFHLFFECVVNAIKRKVTEENYF
jgi:hypothetical protein